MKKARGELLFFKDQRSFQSSSAEYSSVCFTGRVMEGLYVGPSALLNNLHCMGTYLCVCIYVCVRVCVCSHGLESCV